MSGSNAWPPIGEIAKRLSVLLIISVLFCSHIGAMSPAQKLIFQKNIRYFNHLAACGGDTESETPADDVTVSGNTQELAQQMLKNNHVTYWTNAPEGAASNWQSRVPAGGNTSSIDTKDVVRALAQGDPAYTTAGNAPDKTAELNPNILKFILEAADKGNIMVNALTDKTHSSSSSNHYKGLAVDLDLNTTVPLSELNKIADKYGGVKNSESDHHHYDFLNRPKESDSPTGPSGGTSKIYMLGDSVTVGAYYVTSDLKRDFAAEKWSVEMDASGGRGMEYAGSEDRGTLPGRTKSGLEAIKADSDAIKKSDTVVIALGTNESNTDLNASRSADIFKDQMKEAISSVKKINPDAVIYWVNISSKPTSITPYVKEYNEVIDSVAAATDVNVIDVAKAGIPLNPDGIHPDYGEGWEKWSRTVVDGIKNGGPGAVADDSTAPKCECDPAGVSGSLILVGSTREEQIFNFFVSQGLEPYQAAAIMGNMNAESGLDPTVFEGGTHDGDYPKDGVGFGLVQWTFSDRQDPLVKLARKEGVKPTNLGVQLEYVMIELQGKYKDVFNKLKASGNVEAATVIIETEYEVHAGGVQPERTADAKSYLAKYGSGVGDAGSVSDESACVTDESGSVVGEYSLPVNKLIYTAHEDWFSAPHHDYPAVDIPVPSGTKVYSMTAGKVIVAPAGGGCGNGVLIDAGNGVEYGYCHGSDGGSIAGAKTGDTVKPGQFIMHSDNTGTSTGPHLHIQIKVKGTLHCPQNLFKSIVKGSPESESSLPVSGCTS